MRGILLFFFLTFSYHLLYADTLNIENSRVDSADVVYSHNENIQTEVDTTKIDEKYSKRGFLPAIIRGVSNIVREFNNYDTLYIEPQHYKFQAMCQMTNIYEQYRLKSPDGYNIFMSPDVRTTVGPYIGYSLIFLGYTLQLNKLYIGNAKKTFNLSLYTSLIGVDLHYHNDNNFNIRRITDTSGDVTEMRYVTNALNVKRWGFNTYYIFNYRKHSYPAAYNQSTCQLRSSGSPLAGVGYNNYDISISWDKINEALPPKLRTTDLQTAEGNIPQQQIQYQAYSFYGGYSYNWVPMRNLLIGASATLSLSYNKTHGEKLRVDHLFKDLDIRNVSVDGIGRIGIVWNNTRFFAGASAQIHSYTYSKKHLSINNTFGNLNIYAGLNFGKKKAYRKSNKSFEF